MGGIEYKQPLGEWECFVCMMKGHDPCEGRGPSQAIRHIRTVHEGEPYLDLCGACTNSVTPVENYCSDECVRIDAKMLRDYAPMNEEEAEGDR